MLTPSLPYHLKTTNKSAKSETLTPFGLLFRTGTWKNFHQMHNTERRCAIGPENILFAGVSVDLSARKFYRLRQWWGNPKHCKAASTASRLFQHMPSACNRLTLFQDIKTSLHDPPIGREVGAPKNIKRIAHFVHRLTDKNMTWWNILIFAGNIIVMKKKKEVGEKKWQNRSFTNVMHSWSRSVTLFMLVKKCNESVL